MLHSSYEKFSSMVSLPYSNATTPPSSSPMTLKLRRLGRPAAILLGFIVLVFFLVPRHRSGPTLLDSTKFESKALYTHPQPGSAEALKFWRELSEALWRGKPSFDEVRRKSDATPWMAYQRDMGDQKRPDYLEMSLDEISEMKKLHRTAVTDFMHLAPTLPFKRGTRGVVTTANNDALAILTTSLWMLRATGSMLPVEIWFYDYESYEAKPCDEIFPSLNAKCMFMVDYLPKDLEHPLHIVKFTYKTLALLFSSFEQVLFLDCDAFAISKPDSLFSTEPFKSNGMVLWPDYWASTHSHYYFEIVGRQMPPIEERATTESGEMLINKATHATALLLAQFYNTYGPEHWHRLFSQAAPGEGDKDTFIGAIQSYDLPFYQVKERPQRAGYLCKGGETKNIGSLQSHPLDDWTINRLGYIRDADETSLGTTLHPRIVFVHGNLPKYDPYIMLDWDLPELNWQDMLRCDNGKGDVHRMWGPKELTVPKFGWDAEHAVWDAMLWSACYHEQDFNAWTVTTIFRPKVRKDVCSKFRVIWHELFPGETFKPVVPKPHGFERPWGGFTVQQMEDHHA